MKWPGKKRPGDITTAGSLKKKKDKQKKKKIESSRRALSRNLAE